MEIKIEESFADSIKSSASLNTGRGMVAYTCSYIPEELIAAANLIPYRVYGNKESNLADKYFPINFCPYVKAVWEEIHHNTILDAIILATSCDGIRRLNDYISYYEKELPVFMLDIPRKSDKDSLGFFAHNLKNLWIFLCGISNVDPGNTDIIKASSSIINRKRTLLKELTKHYEADMHQIIKNDDYFNIINISLSSETDTFNNELESYIKKIKSLKENYDTVHNDFKSNLKIMIIGNYINDNNFWSIFENLNVKLISSDICITYRYFDIGLEKNYEAPGLENDIFTDIANSFISKPACFRMADIKSKLNDIKAQIYENNINGVIFASLKFCDNTLYSFPALKNELNKMKIPSIFLDIEYGKSSYGQLKTRIEAFIEMLNL
ncbi:MAG: 2-hydroxyacyl-CoA dehydratase family protein [Actinomycetota bacterium]|jgi:benzoyl-CoA reductase/2-hydroxyglutaryl-CoA dehydratase subunit BcrC/BadD/HgdB|nr:2-hydroxyacyl-CoA dehydratase family protein [Actinomycetota bacterium]